MPFSFRAFPDDAAASLIAKWMAESHCIEIATGYFFGGALGGWDEAVKRYLAADEHQLRVLVSASPEQTNGRAVEKLLEQRADCVRWFDPSYEKGIFHPKMCCFHTVSGRRLFLGSANFTYQAWHSNVEWNCLVEDDDDETARRFITEALRVFDEAWECSPTIADEALKRFIAAQENPEKEVWMPDFKIGDKVRHKNQPAWGIGEILQLKLGAATVDFGAHVPKVPFGLLEPAVELTEQLVDALCAGVGGMPDEFFLRTQARFLSIVNANTGALSRTRVDVLPHQMLVTHRVVSSEPVRWLVADDVGLGKTVEAGLIATALHTQGRGERILIVVPATLTRQWQEEMREKFNLDFVIYGNAVAKSFGGDGQHFWKQPRVIASIDTLKQPHILATLADTNWDLVVFDEAHKLTAYDGYYADRYRVAEKLAQDGNVKAEIFLTATPHQGNPERFYHLMNLVRPDLFPNFRTFNSTRKRLPEAMIRNRKGEVTDATGKPLFHGIYPTQAIKVPLSEAELKFLSALHDYLRAGYQNIEGKTSPQSNAIGFVLTTFQKLASSSRAAIEGALTQRLAALQAAARRKGPATRVVAKVTWDEESDERTEEEDLADRPEIGRAKSFVTNEVARLKKLLRLLSATTTDSKWTVFSRQLTQLEKAEPGASVLIFTEYRRTQDFLVAKLKTRFKKVGVVQINGGMSLEEKMDNAADFNAGRARFLVSTEAGGEGINLQESCHIVWNYDLPWNPMRLHQRIGRVYRYGQTQRVRVFQFHLDGKITIQSSAGRSKTVELIDDRIQRILHDNIERIVADMKDAHPGEAPENIREYLLGELIEQKNFRLPELFRRAVLTGDTKEAETKLNEALKKVQKAQGQFSQVFGQVPGFALGDYREIEPAGAMSDVERFAHTFVMAHSKKKKGIWTTKPDGTIDLEVPPAARIHAKVRDRYEHLTFDRTLVQKSKEAELLGFGHELLDAMIRRSLESSTEAAFAVQVIPGSPWKGTWGIEWNWLIMMQTGDHNQPAAREEWLTTFVDSHGQLAPDIAANLRSMPPGTAPLKPLALVIGRKAAAAIIQKAYEVAEVEAEKERQRLLDDYKARFPNNVEPVGIRTLFSASIVQFT